MNKNLLTALSIIILAGSITGSPPALAGDVAHAPYAGYYWGITDQNEECQVGVPNGLHGAVSVQWIDSRGRADGCIFMAQKIVESPGLAKASGTNGKYHCKLRLHLNSEGRIESADLAFGGIFNFGYNTTCRDLKELNEF